jgi:hypothetical protein
MRLLLRCAGALVLLLSTVGLVCCVAGVVGVWMLRQTASEKVLNISARIDAGLQRVSLANENVRRALEKARADVAKVSKGSADLGGGAEKGRPATGTLRGLIQRQVGPEINELGGRLATCSDAAVAVTSLLQSFEELAPGQTGRIEPDKLERLADQASQLSAAVQRLQAVVGDEDKGAAEKEVVAAAGEVELVLRKCQATVDHWQSDLDAGPNEILRVKAEILRWLTLIAIAATVICVWVAMSQISLFAHALKWGRGG